MHPMLKKLKVPGKLFSMSKSFYKNNLEVKKHMEDVQFYTSSQFYRSSQEIEDSNPFKARRRSHILQENMGQNYNSIGINFNKTISNYSTSKNVSNREKRHNSAGIMLEDLGEEDLSTNGRAARQIQTKENNRNLQIQINNSEFDYQQQNSMSVRVDDTNLTPATIKQQPTILAIRKKMGTTGTFSNDFASANRTADSKTRAKTSQKSYMFGVTNTSGFNINSSNDYERLHKVDNKIKIKNRMSNILNMNVSFDN